LETVIGLVPVGLLKGQLEIWGFPFLFGNCRKEGFKDSTKNVPHNLFPTQSYIKFISLNSFITSVVKIDKFLSMKTSVGFAPTNIDKIDKKFK
jgi:hypothetical protein